MLGEAELARIVAELIDNTQATVTEIVESASARISAIDEYADVRALLEASAAENIVAAISYVQGRVRLDELEAPTAALSYARLLAQRDVPMSALVRAYRIGHGVVLDTAFERLEGAVPLEHRFEVAVMLVRRSQDYIDRIVEQVGHAYETERERWVTSLGGVRQQWVSDLLGGARVDAGEASRALGYPVGGRHVAVRLWPASAMTPAEASSAVAEVQERLATSLRARSFLPVPTDEREVRLWLATDRLPEPGTPAGARVHAAFGLPAEGLEGFRRSARQADLVHAVIAGQERRATWLRYDEVAPVALLAQDPRGLREFVLATLGDLAVPSERTETLRETLRVFLARRRSYATAGEELNLHRNSVQYRVQRAFELLPRIPEDDLHLRMALEAASLLGASLLAD